MASPYNYGYAAGYAPYAAGYAAPYAAGYAAPYTAGYAAPYAYNYAAPQAVVPAPIQTPSSQFHAQDEFGNLNYGYANINSQKHEVGNSYGGVTGGYSYVDANGELQKVEYIADALGFRVKATNLPVAPAVPEVEPLEAPVFTGKAPVYTGVAPTAPEDTKEVADAKAEFFKAFEKEANREKREADIVAPLAYNFGYAAGYPYSAAYAYAAGFGYPYSAATTLLAKDEKTPAATTAAELATVVAPAPLHYTTAPYASYASAPYAYASYAPKTFGYSSYAASPAFGYSGLPYAYAAPAYAAPAAISA